MNPPQVQFEEPQLGRASKLENVLSAEHDHMTALTQLQQNRRIVRDFTITTLAGIPGLFARLIYMGSLRDLSSGRYEHAGLAALYPEQALQQALQLCHEQIFERILETPLSNQHEDLRTCLAAMQGGLSAAVTHWHRMESYRFLVPEESPDYLKELFYSNLRALLELLQEEYTGARSDG
jgi:hypothetical protein